MTCSTSLTSACMSTSAMLWRDHDKDCSSRSKPNAHIHVWKTNFYASRKRKRKKKNRKNVASSKHKHIQTKVDIETHINSETHTTSETHVSAHSYTRISEPPVFLPSSKFLAWLIKSHHVPRAQLQYAAQNFTFENRLQS